MLKILITGASGFIGKSLLRSLLPYYDVRVLARQSSVIDIDESCIYRDNNDIDDLIKYFKRENFWGVVHLATYFRVQHSTEDFPAMLLSNVELGCRILEAAVNTSKPWVINMGSTWQNYYGNYYCPVNLYAATKQAFEDIAAYYVDAHKLNFVTLKISDTYGPNDTRKKIINLLASLDGFGSLMMSPGGQYLNLIYIDDVISAILLLIKLIDREQLCEKSYYIKADETLTLYEIVAKLEKVLGRKLNIIWGQKYRNREVMMPVFSGLPLPGWVPLYNLDEGLKHIVASK